MEIQFKYLRYKVVEFTLRWKTIFKDIQKIEVKIMNDASPENSRTLEKIINHPSFSDEQKSEIQKAFCIAKDWDELFIWLMESKTISENTGFFPPFKK